MLILPLKFVRTEDKNLIGENLFNLSKLKHLDFPVIESVIAIPPVEAFKKIVDRFRRQNARLKDHIGNISQAMSDIKIPESLENFSIVHFSDSDKTIKVNTSLLWSNLLSKWVFELTSKIERDDKDIFKFTPQLIIFSANFTGFGRGYFDEDRDHVVIKTDSGSLDFNMSQEIENLIILGNKKLILPQVYYWVIEDGKSGVPGGIKIIKLAPFTQSFPDENEKIEDTVQIRPKKSLPKTATKIILDHKTGMLNGLDSDGILLKIEKTDEESINSELTKIQNFQKNLKIIFYPDFKSNEFKELDFAKSFLFFRNKKKLDISVVIPKTYSIESFLKAKTDFASLGIYSKGSLKIWKEFSTAVDFLMMDEYLEAGFDGALINLDEIGRIVTGVDPQTIRDEPKRDWIKSIELFLKELKFGRLIKENKQVLVYGILAENEELLGYFIKSGVWGVVFRQNVADAFKEHIAYLESLHLKKLTYAKVE